MYDIQSHICPAIVILSGKKYIVPQWIEVPDNTELSDINWIKPKYNTVPELQYTEHVVVGSKGNTYIIRKFSDRLECSCPGFEFYKNCKHIKEYGKTRNVTN